MKNMCALFNMKFHAYFIKLICSIAAHRIFKCVKMTFSCTTYSFGAFYVEWGKIRFDSLITGSFMIFTPFKFRTSAILPIFMNFFWIYLVFTSTTKYECTLSVNFFTQWRAFTIKFTMKSMKMHFITSIFGKSLYFLLLINDLWLVYF